MTLTTLKETVRAEFENILFESKEDEGNIEHVDEYYGDFLKRIDSIIDRTYHVTKEEVRGMPAFKNLKEEQGQLDEDGIMVAVSRQALDELISALEDTTTSPDVS